MRDVHLCVTVFYQQLEKGTVASQIYGFTIDYGKFILISYCIYVNYIRVQSTDNRSLHNNKAKVIQGPSFSASE